MLITLVDEEDVVLVGDSQDKEVCYGRIEGAEINAHKVPTPKDGARAIAPGLWPQVKIVLRRRVGERTTVIYAVDSTREIIGCVDVSTSIGLAPILDSKFGIRTASRILTRPRRPDDQPPGSEVSCRYGLDLNLYGPKKYALIFRRSNYGCAHHCLLRLVFKCITLTRYRNPHHLSSGLSECSIVCKVLCVQLRKFGTRSSACSILWRSREIFQR
jgi:hypothetical protein